MISYIISYLSSSCAIDIVHDVVIKRDIIYDIIVHFMVSYMISCSVIMKTVSRFISMILAMTSFQYHKKTAMTSLTSDINGILHMFLPMLSLTYDISSKSVPFDITFYCDITVLIVVSARWDGTGWGRHAPGAPPPSASPQSTNWEAAAVQVASAT
jgi:hypothetical protein